jgi:hypothetical protein
VAPCSVRVKQGELEQLHIVAPASGSRSLLVAEQEFVMEFDEDATTLAEGANVDNFYPGVTFENAVKALNSAPDQANRTPNCIRSDPTGSTRVITINVPSGFEEYFRLVVLAPGEASYTVAGLSDINGQGPPFVTRGRTRTGFSQQAWEASGKCEAQ